VVKSPFSSCLKIERAKRRLDPHFVSAVVVWEIRIKEALGKLEIPRNFKRVLESQPFEMLDITVEHAHAVRDLPVHHRDPFDRMLVAQAKAEGFTLVTHDVRLKKYKVSLMEI